MQKAASCPVLEFCSVPADPKLGSLDSEFVHREGLAAVIDCELEGTPTEQRAAEARELATALQYALLTVDLRNEAFEALDDISSFLAERASHHTDAALRPWASLALFNAGRREIWMVGETLARVDGVPYGKSSLSRTMRQQARRAAVRQLKSEGATDQEILLLPPPPPSAALAPALNGTLNPLAIGALNGDRIPPWHIEVIEVPPNVQEVVLATRGYPYAGDTLQESELLLRELMLADPLGVDQALTDDGWRLGTCGFADRTYLRVGTPA